MAKYRVQIDAQNFLVDMDGRRDKYGFITFRDVEAADARAAELAAVELLRGDAELCAIVQNAPDDPPVMDVEEIVELEASGEPSIPPGRIWYAMKPKRWWQLWR